MKRPRKPVRRESETTVRENVDFVGKVTDIISMLEQYQDCEIHVESLGYDCGYEYHNVKVDTESDKSLNKRIKEYEQELKRYQEYRKKRKVYEDKIKELEQSMKEA